MGFFLIALWARNYSEFKQNFCRHGGGEFLLPSARNLLKILMKILQRAGAEKSCKKSLFKLDINEYGLYLI